MNPSDFRWARFCCTSRWMSSFDNVPGFRRRPTFAVALTALLAVTSPLRVCARVVSPPGSSNEDSSSKVSDDSSSRSESMER